MGWNGVVAFSLEEVHSIETEGFNLDDGFGAFGLGLRDFCDVEGIDAAFSAGNA